MTGSNIDHLTFNGQHSLFSQFQEKQESVVIELNSGLDCSDTYTGSPLNPILSSTLSRLAIVEPRTALYVLLAVAIHAPEPLKTAEIEGLVHFHRSTVSKYAVELVKFNLLRQNIAEGTENKHKPTYLYSLTSDISPEQVINFCSSCNVFLTSTTSSTTDLYSEELSSEDSIETFDEASDEANAESKFANETSSANRLKDNSGSDVNEVSNSVVSPMNKSSFEKRMETVLTQMATEIAKLRKRVASLEEELKHRSQDTGEVDLDQVISILQSPE